MSWMVLVLSLAGVKGGVPLNNMNRITPTPHKSLFSVASSPPNTSGLV